MIFVMPVYLAPSCQRQMSDEMLAACFDENGKPKPPAISTKMWDEIAEPALEYYIGSEFSK